MGPLRIPTLTGRAEERGQDTPPLNPTGWTLSPSRTRRIAHMAYTHQAEVTCKASRMMSQRRSGGAWASL